MLVAGSVNPDPVQLRMNAGAGQAFLRAVFAAAAGALGPAAPEVETAPAASGVEVLPLPSRGGVSGPLDDGSPRVTSGGHAMVAVLHAAPAPGVGAGVGAAGGAADDPFAANALGEEELRQQAGVLLGSLGLHRFATRVPGDGGARPQRMPFDLSGTREATTPCTRLTSDPPTPHPHPAPTPAPSTHTDTRTKHFSCTSALSVRVHLADKRLCDCPVTRLTGALQWRHRSWAKLTTTSPAATLYPPRPCTWSSVAGTAWLPCGAWWSPPSARRTWGR